MIFRELKQEIEKKKKKQNNFRVAKTPIEIEYKERLQKNDK